MVDNFMTPWFELTCQPINKMRAQKWVHERYIEIEEFHIKNWALILAFPLSVVSTNRILDTAISRSGSANSWRPELLYRDLVALARMNGHRTLFAGFIPAMAYLYINTKKKQKKNAEIYNQSRVTTTTTARRAIQEQFGISDKNLR